MISLIDCLDITIAVDWDVKPQTKPKPKSKVVNRLTLACMHVIFTWGKIFMTMPESSRI